MGHLSQLLHLFIAQFYFGSFVIGHGQFPIEIESHNGFKLRYNGIIRYCLTLTALQISRISTRPPLIENKVCKYAWRVELVLYIQQH